MRCTHICPVLVSLLHLVVCSYILCGFSLLSKYLFMLVRNSYWLVGIAIGPGRQNIIAPGLPAGEAENQGSQQFVKSRQQNKKNVQKKVKEKEVAGQKLLLQSLRSLVVCICC